jgi:hypothetical protein
MRGVPLLIRLAQHELEEKRSDLGYISRARAETEEAIGAHDEAAISEAAVVLADPATMATFSAWSRQSARGRVQLQQRFRELDAGTAAARESVRDAAAQVRRLEVVVEEMGAKARKVATRRADARADERELARAMRIPPVG